MGIELFFIAFFIFYAIRGYQKGLLSQLTWILALSVEIACWPLVMSFFTYFLAMIPTENQFFFNEQGVQFFFGYFMIYFILKSVFLITIGLKIPLLTPINRFFGSFLAIIKASWLLFWGIQLIEFFLPEVFVQINQGVIIMAIQANWDPIVNALIQWLFA
ncbi:MAG: hypothetical protein ACRC5Q_02990 [Culicoidibacterales bacterium]